jgi:signal transduction histidine kinase
MDDPGVVDVTVQARDGQAVVSVRDTGRGIKPEHLANIFRPFFTTKGHGTDWGCRWRGGSWKTTEERSWSRARWGRAARSK